MLNVRPFMFAAAAAAPGAQCRVSVLQCVSVHHQLNRFICQCAGCARRVVILAVMGTSRFIRPLNAVMQLLLLNINA